MLIRVGNYLKLKKRLILEYERQEPVDDIATFSDGNLGGLPDV